MFNVPWNQSCQKKISFKELLIYISFLKKNWKKIGINLNFSWPPTADLEELRYAWKACRLLSFHGAAFFVERLYHGLFNTHFNKIFLKCITRGYGLTLIQYLLLYYHNICSTITDRKNYIFNRFCLGSSHLKILFEKNCF